MAERPVASPQEMHEEGDSFTGGPGVVATKSQARGSLAGIVIGTLLGALLGFLVGSFLEGGRGMIIAVIVFAVAGATAGGVSGGFMRPRKKLPDSDADVR